MSKSNSKRKHVSEAALASKMQKSGAKPVDFETAIDTAQKGLEREFDANSVSDYYRSFADAVAAVLSTNSRANEWFPPPISAIIVGYTQTAPSALEEVIRTKQERCCNAVRWYFRYLSSVTVLSSEHVDQLPLMRNFMNAHSAGALMVITNSLVNRPQVKSPSECTLVVEVHRLISESRAYCRVLYQWLLNTNSYAVMPRLLDDVARDRRLIVDSEIVIDCLAHGVGVVALVRLYAFARKFIRGSGCDDRVSEYIGTHFNLDEFLKTAEAEQLQDVLGFILQFVADQAMFVQLEQHIRALTINAQNVTFWAEIWHALPGGPGAYVVLTATLAAKLDEYDSTVASA